MTSLRSGVKLKEMIKCIVHRIKNIFSFSEEVGRLDFFLTFIVTIIITNLPIFLSIFYKPFDKLYDFIFASDYGIGGYIILIIILHLANICRRLNDMGKNNGYALIAFIPALNLILLLALLLTPREKKNK